MARNSDIGFNRGFSSSQLVSEPSVLDQQWKARMSRMSSLLEENAKLLQELKKSKNPSQEMSKNFTDQDSQPNRILFVTIHTMLYPITEEVLHQVFSPYGFVEKIVILQETVGFQARIQFQSHQNAVEAMNSLQGRCIYDDCCQLAIQISNFSEEFQTSYSSGGGISRDDCWILSSESKESRDISRPGTRDSSKRDYEPTHISQTQMNVDFSEEFQPAHSLGSSMARNSSMRVYRGFRASQMPMSVPMRSDPSSSNNEYKKHLRSHQSPAPVTISSSKKTQQGCSTNASKAPAGSWRNKQRVAEASRRGVSPSTYLSTPRRWDKPYLSKDEDLSPPRKNKEPELLPTEKIKKKKMKKPRSSRLHRKPKLKKRPWQISSKRKAKLKNPPWPISSKKKKNKKTAWYALNESPKAQVISEVPPEGISRAELEEKVGGQIFRFGSSQTDENLFHGTRFWEQNQIEFRKHDGYRSTQSLGHSGTPETNLTSSHNFLGDNRKQGNQPLGSGYSVVGTSPSWNHMMQTSQYFAPIDARTKNMMLPEGILKSSMLRPTEHDSALDIPFERSGQFVWAPGQFVWAQDDDVGNNAEGRSTRHHIPDIGLSLQLATTREFMLGPHIPENSIESPTYITQLSKVQMQNICDASNCETSSDAGKYRTQNSTNWMATIDLEVSNTAYSSDFSTMWFDQGKFGIPFSDDSSLTMAEKQRFSIRELYPEWAFSSEPTKFILVEDFLCSSSECSWAIMFGLQNLQAETNNPKTQTFSLLLADTVIVSSEKPPEVLTAGCSKLVRDLVKMFPTLDLGTRSNLRGGNCQDLKNNLGACQLSQGPWEFEDWWLGELGTDMQVKGLLCKYC